MRAWRPCRSRLRRVFGPRWQRYSCPLPERPQRVPSARLAGPASDPYALFEQAQRGPAALPGGQPAGGRSSPARFVVAIASGKGGVGKSTLSLNLALALRERGFAVGLLDADIYGPDIPLMVNLTRRERRKEWSFWQRGAGPARLEPLERFSLRIMSVGFLLAEEQAVTWSAPLVQALLRQLLEDVAWGELDFLLVDLPPGTADVQQGLIALVPLAGAIVVVGPQDVAHLDARKLLELFADANVPVLGAVENMTALTCPHCGEPIEVFPEVAAGRSLFAAGVARIARIPLEPAIALAGDRGQPLFLAAPGSVAAEAFRAIAAHTVEALGARPGN